MTKTDLLTAKTELDIFEKLSDALWFWKIDISGDKKNLWMKKWDINGHTSNYLKPVVTWLEWQKSHDYAKGFSDKFQELYNEVRDFYAELEQGKLDEEEICQERIPLLEDRAKQLAKHVLTVKHLCKKQFEFELNPKDRKEQTEQNGGLTNEEVYAEIDLARRKIIIGSKTFKPTADSIWDFLKELVAANKQGRLVPKDTYGHNWKDAVDTLRRKKRGIGRKNLRRIVQFQRGGYSLAGDVQIKW